MVINSGFVGLLSLQILGNAKCNLSLEICLDSNTFLHIIFYTKQIGPSDFSVGPLKEDYMWKQPKLNKQIENSSRSESTFKSKTSIVSSCGKTFAWTPLTNRNMSVSAYKHKSVFYQVNTQEKLSSWQLRVLCHNLEMIRWHHALLNRL